MSYKEFLIDATATFHTGWMTGSCSYDVRYKGEHIDYVICDSEEEALVSVYDRLYANEDKQYQTR